MQRRSISIIFASLLIASIVLPTTQVKALDAIATTNQTTLTSLSSYQWDHVWTNPAGTATYFVDGDSGVFKSSKLTHSGYGTSTVIAPLIGAASNPSSIVVSSTATDVKFLSTIGGTDHLLRTGSTTFATEHAATASSLLIGHTVNSLILNLKKTGTASGTATIAVFDSSGNTVYSFGTQNVASLTTSYVATTFTSTAAPYTIASGDRIGVFFNGGSAGNELGVEYKNANVFDGTSATVVSTGTGTQGSAAYTAQTGQELVFTLSLVYQASYANDDNTATSWMNGGYVVRATQTDFTTSSAQMRSGSVTIIAEQITATAALVGKSVDTLKMYIAKVGSPTGTVTAGVFDGSGNVLYTFGTMSAASLTTSNVLYTFTNTGGDHTITSTTYIGLSFSGGSVGNTVLSVVANPASGVIYDGNNAQYAEYNAGWGTSSGADLGFQVTDTDQESGAYIGVNQNNALPIGGLSINFQDAAKIPQIVDQDTSTDGAAWTNRVNDVTLTQSTGAQSHNYDTVYDVQYGRLVVDTWGSALLYSVAELDVIPAGNADTALSPIVEDGGVRFVFYLTANDDASGPQDWYYGKINIDTGAIIAAATDATTAQADVIRAGSVSKTKAYFSYQINSGSDLGITSFNYDLSNYAQVTTATTVSASAYLPIVAYDNNPDDIVFVVTETGGDLSIWKCTNPAGATCGAVALADSAWAGNLLTGEVYQTAVNTYIIAGGDSSPAFKTYLIDGVSSTSYSIVDEIAKVTYDTQSFDISASTRTWKTQDQYIASTTQASDLDNTSGALTPGYLYIETVNNSTATITGINENFYLITEGIYASKSGTTWTIKSVNNPTSVTTTTYTENLDVPLQANTSIAATGVIELVCDANYVMFNQKLKVGDDDDCTIYRVRDVTSNPIGRTLPYLPTKNLVHAEDYTNYNIHITSASQEALRVTIQYDGKDVDSNTFDGSDNAQLRMVYGQCYDIVYTEVLTGDPVQADTLCADDVGFKEAIITAGLSFNFWTNPWGVFHRYNVTTNMLDLTVRHEPAPYNYTVNVSVNNGTLVVNNNYTAAQILDSRSLNLSAYESGEPLKLMVFNDNGENIYFVYLDDSPLYLKPIADLFVDMNFAGWNILFFLPLIFIAMFTKNNIGIGAGVSGAFIAVLDWVGIFDLPDPVVWIIVVVGVVVFFAARKKDDF